MSSTITHSLHYITNRIGNYFTNGKVEAFKCSARHGKIQLKSHLFEEI